jgi:hypothetical protein
LGSACALTAPLCAVASGANEVFEALSTAVSAVVGGQQRAAATSTLQAWERSAAPGFVGALAQIAGQPVREQQPPFLAPRVP